MIITFSDVCDCINTRKNYNMDMMKTFFNGSGEEKMKQLTEPWVIVAINKTIIVPDIVRVVTVC
ncbi:hypothetical protein Hdeb2414_s0014g00433001 [Helianthus debilis subsp. tardiflorus]